MKDLKFVPDSVVADKIQKEGWEKLGMGRYKREVEGKKQSASFSDLRNLYFGDKTEEQLREESPKSFY